MRLIKGMILPVDWGDCGPGLDPAVPKGVRDDSSSPCTPQPLSGPSLNSFLASEEFIKEWAVLEMGELPPWGLGLFYWQLIKWWINYLGRGFFLGRRFSHLFSLTWSGSRAFFVSGLSGLILFLVALVVECCQDRLLTSLMTGYDSPFAGLRASC